MNTKNDRVRFICQTEHSLSRHVSIVSFAMTMDTSSALLQATTSNCQEHDDLSVKNHRPVSALPLRSGNDRASTNPSPVSHPPIDQRASRKLITQEQDRTIKNLKLRLFAVIIGYHIPVSEAPDDTRSASRRYKRTKRSDHGTNLIREVDHLADAALDNQFGTLVARKESNVYLSSV